MYNTNFIKYKTLTKVDMPLTKEIKYKTHQTLQ